MSKTTLCIGLDNYVGRRITSRQRARQASRGRPVSPAVIRPKVGEHKVSVDKLEGSSNKPLAYSRQILKIALSANDSLFGWLAFARKDVENVEGCCVNPSPTTQNPFHADIIFPKSVCTNVNHGNELAADLMEFAHWLEYRNPYS